MASLADISAPVLPTFPGHGQADRNFQREMFDKRQEAQAWKEAAKDFQIDYNNVDKLYIPKMEQLVGKFATESIASHAKDKRYLQSAPYMISVADVAAKKNQLVKLTVDAANYRKMVKDHPDAVRPINERLHQGIMSGDPNIVEQETGNLTGFNPMDNLRPNVDVGEKIEEGIKRLTPDYNIVDTGKVIGNEKILKKFPKYTPEGWGVVSKQQWDGSTALQAMFPNPMDYTHEGWNVIEQKMKSGAVDTQAIYHPPASTTKADKDAQLGLDDLVSKGVVQVDQEEIIPSGPKGTKDASGNVTVSYTGTGKTPSPYEMSVKTTGSTIVANNGKVIDQTNNHYVTDNTQFKFTAGKIRLLKDNKTKKYEPYVIGQETDRVSQTSASGTTTERPSTRAIAVPLKLVDNFLRESGNQVDWAYEAAERLNGGKKATKQSPPPVSVEISSEAEYNALPSGTEYIVNGKKFRKK